MSNKKKTLFNLLCNISLALIVAVGLITIVATGGGGGETPDPPIVEDDSWMELENYIKEQFSETVLPSDIYTVPAGAIARNTFEDAAAATAGSAESEGDGYSQTNVQEAGVDEADKVKTDGTYLYVAGDQIVYVVSAIPADSMGLLSTINVNGAVDSLYLYNDILIVLYTPYEEFDSTPWPVDEIGIPYWIPVWAQTGVLMMDVTDPDSPEWINEWSIEGWQVSSRLTNGRLHIVQQFLPDLPPLQLTYDGTEQGLAEAVAANDQALESLTIDELIPSYEIFDEQGNQSGGGRLVVPEDFYRPDEPSGGSIISVVTFDLDNISEGFKSVGLIADAHTVYASTQALYTASTQWNYTAGPEVLNEEYCETILCKFSLTGEDVIMEGTGEVTGKILNQFSLGEYDNVLRIATTTGGFWGATVDNNVYCLEAVDGGLEIIGRLEGLAPGEEIYSARFIGTHGFLVTFVRIDPLFTLDLSDPYNPVVVGELKVPGYSDYIHPLGEDHLITIGKDTVLEDGMVWYQGVQLSIFDISDFANPQLLYKELIGDRGTESEALYNHKAFTFWAENSLLAIPVDLFEHQTAPDYLYSYGNHTFTGLYVYRVTVEDGFEYLGRISTASATGNTYYWNNDWLRGVFISEDVYAVNSEAVRSADIDDIAGMVNTLLFN